MVLFRLLCVHVSLFITSQSILVYPSTWSAGMGLWSDYTYISWRIYKCTKCSLWSQEGVIHAVCEMFILGALPSLCFSQELTRCSQDQAAVLFSDIASGISQRAKYTPMSATAGLHLGQLQPTSARWCFAHWDLCQSHVNPSKGWGIWKIPDTLICATLLFQPLTTDLTWQNSYALFVLLTGYN